MATNEQWRQWMEEYGKRVDVEEVPQEVARVHDIPQEEEEEAPKIKSVSDELQDLCDILLDDATGVTWDLYRLDQRDKLDLKIRMALFPESISVKENGFVSKFKLKSCNIFSISMISCFFSTKSLNLPTPVFAKET